MERIVLKNLPSGMTLNLSDKMNAPDWDKFLEHNPSGQYEQSSGWARAKALYGWRPLRLLICKEEKIIGGLQILKKRIPLFGSFGYATKGPVLSENKEELFNLLMTFLKVIIRKNRIQYLFLQPPDRDGLMEEWLKVCGFRIDKLVDVVNATTSLDLSLDLGEIFHNMSKNNKRFIKYAEKKGVTIRNGSEVDILKFFQMMAETCRRQGVQPNPPDDRFIKELWRIFNPKGYVKLFVTVFEGDVTSELIIFPFGDTVRAWKMGWNGRHEKVKPNQILFWEAIKWSKEHGYRYFDFVSIDRDIAELILKGVHFSKIAKGSSFFKLMFGGEVSLLPYGYCYIYNPVFQIAYSKFYLKIIDKPFFQKILSRYLGFLPIKKSNNSG